MLTEGQKYFLNRRKWAGIAVMPLEPGKSACYIVMRRASSLTPWVAIDSASPPLSNSRVAIGVGKALIAIDGAYDPDGVFGVVEVNGSEITLVHTFEPAGREFIEDIDSATGNYKDFGSW